MTDKLDCGHEPSKHGEHTTGYGSMDGKTYCYECCADFDRQAMIEDGHLTLYVSYDHGRCVAAVTNWPGSLRFPVKHQRPSRGYGFGREYQITHVWFNGPDGYEWVGRNAGDMDLTRCKRTKVRS